MSLNLKQLEAFCAVADLRSFRRAAERLNTTQPNISSRIAKLEARLGVTLMIRDAGSVRLTPKGEALLPRARQTLRAVDEFLSAVEDDSLFDGTMRLGVTEMIAHAWLSDFLLALKARFPNVVLDLEVDRSSNLSEALLNRSLYLTLQSGPFKRETGAAIDLGCYAYVWVAAPALGLGSKRLTLATLKRQTVLAHARGTLPYEQIRQHFAAVEPAGVHVTQSSDMGACLKMTLDGLGVACLPHIMVSDHLVAGALEQVRYAWTPSPLCFWARYDPETAPAFVRDAAQLAASVATDALAKDKERLSS